MIDGLFPAVFKIFYLKNEFKQDLIKHIELIIIFRK